MAESFGIKLVKGSTYMYRGVRFRKNADAEVDRATRDHLVGSGHFVDILVEKPVAAPIAVRTYHDKLQNQPLPDGYTVAAEGGATATGRPVAAQPEEEGDEV